MVKTFSTVVMVLGLALAAPAQAGSEKVVGAVIGGTAGGVIGAQVGGDQGAAIGALIGAVAGAEIARQQQRHDPVYYAPAYQQHYQRPVVQYVTPAPYYYRPPPPVRVVYPAPVHPAYRVDHRGRRDYRHDHSHRGHSQRNDRHDPYRRR